MATEFFLKLGTTTSSSSACGDGLYDVFDLAVRFHRRRSRCSGHG